MGRAGEAVCLNPTSITYRVTPHGLRRTLNDTLRQVAEGEVLRSITGHVTVAMSEHYSHVGLEEKATAIARMEELVATTRLRMDVKRASQKASARIVEDRVEPTSLTELHRLHPKMEKAKQELGFFE